MKFEILMLLVFAALASQQHDLGKNTKLYNSSRSVKDNEGGVERKSDDQLLQRLGYAHTLTEQQQQQHEMLLETAASDDKVTLRRQKFILDAVLNVNGGAEMMNDVGMAFTVNEKDFNHMDDTMLHYLNLYANNEMLQKNELINFLNVEHLRQMVGLYRLMVHAKTWPIFKIVVCFARLRVNDALVTNALALAMHERSETRRLILPPINEILPQLFYSKAFIQQLQRNVNFNDLLSQDAGEQHILPNGQKIWHAGGKSDERTTTAGLGKIVLLQSTIDIHDDRAHQALSLDERIAYLTNDVSLNNLWYAANIRSALTLGESAIASNNTNTDNMNQKQNEHKFDEELTAVISGEDEKEEESNKKTRWQPTLHAHDNIHHNANASDGIHMDIRFLRNGEIFLQTVQQMWARVNLEKLSHLAQEMHEQNLNRNVDLVRLLNERDSLADASVARALPSIQQQLHDSVLLMLHELIALRDQSRPMHLVNSRVRELIGNILLGHRFSEYQSVDVDAIALWRGVEQQLNAALSEGQLILSEMEHHVMNPITRRVIELVVRVTEAISERLPAHTADRMRLEGVQLNGVQVDHLATYWDTIDRDVIKLLPQLDAQRRSSDVPKWHKMLVARQQRLNHRAFNIQINLTADRRRDVVVRLLLGPQLNVAGDLLALNDIRQQYMLIDAFAVTLQPGHNAFIRNSRDIPLTSRDVTPLTQLYKLILLGLDGVQPPLRIDRMRSHNCRMPNYLLLPRGVPQGLPLQLLVVVTERTAIDMTLEQRLPIDLVCGIGTSTMNLDMLPFNFPLDRRIENLQQLIAQPNIMLKDLLVYHEHTNF